MDNSKHDDLPDSSETNILQVPNSKSTSIFRSTSTQQASSHISTLEVVSSSENIPEDFIGVNASENSSPMDTSGNSSTINTLEDSSSMNTTEFYQNLLSIVKDDGLDAAEKELLETIKYDHGSFMNTLLLPYSVRMFIEQLIQKNTNFKTRNDIITALAKAKHHMNLATIIARHADSRGRLWLMEQMKELQIKYVYKLHPHFHGLKKFVYNLHLEDILISFPEDLFFVYFHQWDLLRWLLEKGHVNVAATTQCERNIFNELVDPIRIGAHTQIPPDIFAQLIHPTTMNRKGRDGNYPVHHLAMLKNSNQLYEIFLTSDIDINVRNKCPQLPLEVYLFNTFPPQTLSTTIIKKLSPSQGIPLKLFFKLLIFWLNCSLPQGDVRSLVSTLIVRLNFLPVKSDERIGLWIVGNIQQYLDFIKTDTIRNRVWMTTNQLDFMLSVLNECRLRCDEVYFWFYTNFRNRDILRTEITNWGKKELNLREICVRNIRSSFSCPLTMDNIKKLPLPVLMQDLISLNDLIELVCTKLLEN